MKTARTIFNTLALLLVAMGLTTPSVAQNQQNAAGASAPTTKEDALKRIVPFTKLNDNHQMLASLAGEWTFVGRHISPDKTKKAFEFKGSVTKRPLWGGRYVITETRGQAFPMPWSEGKPVVYNDMMLEGYDNVAKGFVAIFIQNESDTGIIPLKGRYDPSTRAITYDGESTSHVHRDLEPGTKFQFRGVVKLIDRDHYQLDWHESTDGKEIINTVVDYTRVSNK